MPRQTEPTRERHVLLTKAKKQILCRLLSFALAVSQLLQPELDASLPVFLRRQTKKKSSQKHYNSPFINAKLIHKYPLHGLRGDGSNVVYRCAVGDTLGPFPKYIPLIGERSPLAAPLNQSGLLDSNVHIVDTNMRIFILGNSLGQQLSCGLEEAMCYDFHDVASQSNLASLTASERDRELLGNQSRCKSIENPYGMAFSSSPSGGIIGNIIDKLHTEMMSPETRDILSNAAKVLAREVGEASIQNSSDQDVELLDTFVYMFKSGHTQLEDFNESYLEEIISTVSQIFQTPMVIFTTIAMMNNVPREKEDLWRQVNQRIRQFVKNYRSSNATTVKTVEILDYAQLVHEYMTINTNILGMSSNTTYSYRMKGGRADTPIALVCGTAPFSIEPVTKCAPGMVSFDGIHLCPQTMHGRINAGLICLLDCKFNRYHESVSLYQSCSDGCNSKYMSLDPIDFKSNGGVLELTVKP